MRTPWIYIACLIGSPLLAETVGNVEFQFPPSNYEWKLFTQINEDSFFCDDDDCDDENEMVVNIFTHREGDALELFTVATTTTSDDDEEEECTTAELAQKMINDQIGAILPNHKVLIHAFEETETNGFVEWELNDGLQDIVHGYLRALINPDSNTILLSYVTTASKTEQNRELWTQVLKQAKVLE